MTIDQALASTGTPTHFGLTHRSWRVVKTCTVISDHADLPIGDDTRVFYLEMTRPTTTTFGKWYLAAVTSDSVQFFYGGLGRRGYQVTTKPASSYEHAMSKAIAQVLTKVEKGYKDPFS